MKYTTNLTSYSAYGENGKPVARRDVVDSRQTTRPCQSKHNLFVTAIIITTGIAQAQRKLSLAVHTELLKCFDITFQSA